MNILVFDKITRKYKGNISEIVSLIWTERYWECGDFELETPLIHHIISLVEIDDYFKIGYSKTTMVVESVELISPTNSSGGKIKIKGRSLESILDRRILWSDYQRSAPAKTYIPELIEACFTKKDNGEARVVDYLTVKDASDIINEDDDIIEVDASRGDGLYSIISSSAQTAEIGFRIEFDNNTGLMTFYLYEGEDRSNLRFSEQNLILQDANLYRSKENYKNIALVAGEGEGKKRKMVTVTEGDNEPTALQRRELWVDARDVQKLENESNKKYNNRLTLRGVEKLEEHLETITADGKLINLGRYRIREDFNLGDIITIQNQFFTSKSRITEIIQSWDSSDGYTIYPGFITKEVTYRSQEESGINPNPEPDFVNIVFNVSSYFEWSRYTYRDDDRATITLSYDIDNLSREIKTIGLYYTTGYDTIIIKNSNVTIRVFGDDSEIAFVDFNDLGYVLKQQGYILYELKEAYKYDKISFIISSKCGRELLIKRNGNPMKMIFNLTDDFIINNSSKTPQNTNGHIKVSGKLNLKCYTIGQYAANMAMSLYISPPFVLNGNIQKIQGTITSSADLSGNAFLQLTYPKLNGSKNIEYNYGIENIEPTSDIVSLEELCSTSSDILVLNTISTEGMIETDCSGELTLPFNFEVFR